jgi:Kinase/pyrophosphorylase
VAGQAIARKSDAHMPTAATTADTQHVLPHDIRRLERSHFQLRNRSRRELSLPCRSILGPVLRLFEAYLGTETTPRVGAQHMLNAEYFKRIDALNYTMLHDDGQHLDDLEQADVVLVGVLWSYPRGPHQSRTSLCQCGMGSATSCGTPSLRGPDTTVAPAGNDTCPLLAR